VKSHEISNDRNMPFKTVQLAIIGFGRIGQVHYENIRQLGKKASVIAIFDPDKSKGEHLKDEDIPFFHEDEEKVMSLPGLDAVVLCNPTTNHLDSIKLACRYGLQIFCEKPLDSSIDRIRDIEQCVHHAGVSLQVGFNRRFDPNFMKLKSLVTEGAVGVPHLISINSRDPAPPPLEYIIRSGGLFMDMSIHDLDMARHLMNDEVTGVFATGGTLVDASIAQAGDIDTAIMVLKFRKGGMAHIDNSRKAVYGYDQRAEVFGSGGMIRIDNNRPDSHMRYDRDGGHISPPYDFFMDRYPQSYRNELNAFIDAINHNEEVLVDVEDALWATSLAMACNDSLKSGQMVSMDHYMC
jgi:myo-inositol 2-dehydrogenase/D-chiro-inositol 1-dehydrogenase